MTQNGDKTGDILDLNREPSAREESREFSTDDEIRRERQKNTHEVKMVKLNQGPIGKLIGTTDSTLATACFLLALGVLSVIVLAFLAVFASSVGIPYNPEAFDSFAEKILAFLSILAGYVFGVKTSSN